jgi:hypothetical protein
LKARPEGGSELELEFLSIEMDVTMGGNPVMAYDSKGESLDDSKNPVASMFRSLIGTRLKFLLDASNRVEKIEGINEFSNRLSAASSPQTRGMVQGMYNEDYFKQMVDYTKYLPAEPVKPGQTWSAHPEVHTGPFGTLHMDLNYTYKGVETHENRNCAALQFSGPLNGNSDGSSGFMGMKMSLENGQMSGKSWFDPKLGMIVESDIDMNMNLRIGMPSQASPVGNSPAPQTMTAPLTQTIIVKLVDVSQTGK